MAKYFLMIIFALLPFKPTIYAMQKGTSAKLSKAERILSTPLEEIARQAEVKAEKTRVKRAEGEATISRQTLLNRIADVKTGKEGAKESLEKLIDAHPELLSDDKFASSLLFEALLFEDPSVFLFIVKKLGERAKKIVIERNKNNELLLHLAAMFGKDAIVHELLKLDPEASVAKGKNGMTPLHYAAENGREETVKLLMPVILKKQANLCALNFSEEPAILLAAVNGHFDIVNSLLDKSVGCLLAADKNFGDTIAHYAVMGHQAEKLISKLKEVKPEIFKIANNAKLTPLELAKQLLSKAKDSEEKDFRAARVDFLEKFK